MINRGTMNYFNGQTTFRGHHLTNEGTIHWSGQDFHAAPGNNLFTNSGSRLGTFDTAEVEGGQPGVQVAVTYTATGAFVTITDQGCLADHNADGSLNPKTSPTSSPATSMVVARRAAPPTSTATAAPTPTTSPTTSPPTSAADAIDVMPVRAHRSRKADFSVPRLFLTSVPPRRTLNGPI